MKTPYDIDEAKRRFERAEKAARLAIRKGGAGDQNEIIRARRERDKMSELLRWFYYDDRVYYESAEERLRGIERAIVEADERGRASRGAGRDEEIARLRREEAERDAQIDPATRQYRRELGRLRASGRSFGPPAGALPRPPTFMTADDAMEEAVYWLHSNRPDNALPWLTFATDLAVRNGYNQEQLDEIGRYDDRLKKMIPDTWRAYHRGALSIPKITHPKLIAHRQAELDKRRTEEPRRRRPARRR